MSYGRPRFELSPAKSQVNVSAVAREGTRTRRGVPWLGSRHQGRTRIRPADGPWCSWGWSRG